MALCFLTELTQTENKCKISLNKRLDFKMLLDQDLFRFDLFQLKEGLHTSPYIKIGDYSKCSGHQEIRSRGVVQSTAKILLPLLRCPWVPTQLYYNKGVNQTEKHTYSSMNLETTSSGNHKTLCMDSKCSSLTRPATNPNHTKIIRLQIPGSIYMHIHVYVHLQSHFVGLYTVYVYICVCLSFLQKSPV